MKKAIIKIAAINVECPHCRGNLSENGDKETNDLPAWYISAGEEIICEYCNKPYQVSKRFKV